MSNDPTSAGQPTDFLPDWKDVVRGWEEEEAARIAAARGATARPAEARVTQDAPNNAPPPNRS
jgi:hypothetical protein